VLFRSIVSYTAGVPLTDAGGYITAHSNNIYFRGTGTLVTSRNSNFSSSNLASYEGSASSADPLFVNSGALPTGFSGAYHVDLAPASSGLSIQPGSPAADHGAALNSPYATSINSAIRPGGAGWDIGAYETGGSAMTAPRPPTNLRIIPD